MSKEENRLILASALLAILASSLLLPCLTVSAQAIPREEALYMESWEDPATFNSFNPDAPSFRPFLEPLFVFDAWHFQIVPWLAESSEWIDDLTLRITLHDDAAWNDGESLTTADVDYTFTLPLRRTEITGVIADLWTYLEDIDVVNSTTVDFVLNADNPNKYILIQTMTSAEILPEHVWSTLEEQYDNLLDFENLEDPVGSGPYKLQYASVTERRTIWVRNDDYWGVSPFGLPQPKYIVNIVSTSNEIANMIFERGDLDWSENFMPNIWELWEVKHLERGTWSIDEPYYMPVPYMTGIILFNYLHMAEDDAVNDPEVRRAMAFAIDWDSINELAFSKLTTKANPSLLPENVPELAKYINTTAVEHYGWTYNEARANEILDDLGYHVGTGGWRTYANGTKIGPYELLIVEGWTDWEAAAEIVKENLAEVGIDIDVSLVEDATWFDAIQGGTFEMTFDQPSTWTPSIPWYTYYIIYCSRTTPAAVTPAFGNWGSYNNTRVDELLDEIAMTSPENETALTGLYGELQSIILEELPYIIGWFYGPFYMYSKTYWTNWPTKNNPYAGAVPYWDGSHGYFPMLFHIKSNPEALLKRIMDMQQTLTLMQYAAYGSLAISVIAIIIAVVAVVRRRRVE